MFAMGERYLSFRPDNVDMVEDEFIYENQNDLDQLTEDAKNWMINNEVEPENESENIEALRKQLRKKEATIRLLAKLGNGLTNLCEDLKGQNSDFESQISGLQDKISRLQHDNITLKETVKTLEKDLNEMEIAVQENSENYKKVLSSSSSCSNHETLKSLESDNKELRSQILKVGTELKEKEKEMLINCEAMKDLISNLRTSLSVKELEVTTMEKREERLKTEINDLDNRLSFAESESKCFREKVERCDNERNYYKSKYEEVSANYAECQQILDEKKKELVKCKEQTRTKVLRHVPFTSSPYIDSFSLSSELDRCNRTHHFSTTQDHSSKQSSIISVNDWRNETGSLLSVVEGCLADGLTAMSENDCVDGESDISHLNYKLPLGQPGRPGTADLDVALMRLSMLRQGCQSSLRRLDQHHHHRPLSSLSTTSLRRYYNLQEEIAMALDDTSERMPFRSHPRRHRCFEGSHLLLDWQRLGTPDLSRIMECQSGVFIRGSDMSDRFVIDAPSLEDPEEDEIEFSDTNVVNPSNKATPKNEIIDKTSRRRFQQISHVTSHVDVNQTVLHRHDLDEGRLKRNTLEQNCIVA